MNRDVDDFLREVALQHHINEQVRLLVVALYGLFAGSFSYVVPMLLVMP